jgi:hypothetical protein
MGKAIGTVLFLILLSLSGCNEFNDVDRIACTQLCTDKGGALYGFRSDTGSGGYCSCYWKIPKAHVVLDEPTK